MRRLGVLAVVLGLMAPVRAQRPVISTKPGTPFKLATFETAGKVRVGLVLGTWRDPEASQQPILLTASDHNPNGATIRFLVDGAMMPQDAAAYERLVLLFDGEDPDAREAARTRWSEAKSAGFEVTYWRADENGGWRREA